MRLLAFLTVLSVSFAAKSGLDTNTIWDLRSVSDPQITKDAKSVIYVLNWSDKMTDQRYTNLWMVSGDGKDDRPLTTGAYQGYRAAPLAGRHAPGVSFESQRQNADPRPLAR